MKRCLIVDESSVVRKVAARNVDCTRYAKAAGAGAAVSAEAPKKKSPPVVVVE